MPLSTRTIAAALTDYEEQLLLNPILDHPFLVQLREGEFSPEQLGVWISQQFYFSTQFPRCLAALYSRIADYEIAQPLMAFLSIEHWGSPESSAHWKMFQQVLEFFGLNIAQLKKTEPFQETRDYLEYRLSLCTKNTVEEALGALGFGHEFVNAFIFNSYLKGVKKVPGITDATLVYFKAHVDDEPEDYRIFKRMIMAYCTGEKSLELVKKGTDDVLVARHLFFDRIHARLISLH